MGHGKKKLAYCMNWPQSNKYIKSMIQSLETKIFFDKIDILFYIINNQINYPLSH